MVVFARICVVLFAGLLAGCGSIGAAPGGCTDIGAPRGITVRVNPPLPVERLLTVTVCTAADACTTTTIELRDGTATVSETCTGTGPDAACSARVTPDGTLHGFVSLEDLTTEPVTVTASFGSESTDSPAFGPEEVTPEMVYPNGPDCGAMGPQAGITIDG